MLLAVLIKLVLNYVPVLWTKPNNGQIQQTNIFIIRDWILLSYSMKYTEQIAWVVDYRLEGHFLVEMAPLQIYQVSELVNYMSIVPWLFV